MNIQSYLNNNTPRGFKGDGTSLYYDCPHCRGHGKLEADPVKGVYHCHKCKKGGKYQGRGTQREPERVGSKWDKDLFHPMGEESVGYQYLTQTRGLELNQITQLRPHVGPELCRVYFPLYELGKIEPCYYVGRWMFPAIETDLPYLNCPVSDLKRSELVWGLHRFTKPKRQVVICEGIFDAIWKEDRVATLGKSVNQMQARLIASLAMQEIILMPDGDATKESMKTLEMLTRFWAGPISLIRLPFEMDPDDIREDADLLKKERLI